MIISDNNCIDHKGGENMEVLEMSKEEIMKNAMDEFMGIHASETYAKLKDRYLALKVLLNSLGVNITDIDKIKE